MTPEEAAEWYLRGCNPLTGLFVCDCPSESARGLVENVLQSPYGAFCLRLELPWGDIGVDGAGWLQSPYGAFCLRHSAIPIHLKLRVLQWLQSPYGAFCLRRCRFYKF